MKQDKLEKFIQQNRSEFDDKELPPMLWNAIEDEIKPSNGKVFSLKFILSIAASAVVLLCCGLIIGLQMAKPDLEDRIAAVEPDFLEAEKHYQHRVKVDLNHARLLGGDQYVEKDLNQLDAVYQELKNELLTNGVQNDEVIVEAMIDHYRAKLEILETVLGKLEDKNLNINKSDYENIEL